MFSYFKMGRTLNDSKSQAYTVIFDSIISIINI